MGDSLEPPLWLLITVIVGCDLLVGWLLIRRGRARPDQLPNLFPRLRRATASAQKGADREQIVGKIHLADKHNNFFHGNLKDEGKTLGSDRRVLARDAQKRQQN